MQVLELSAPIWPTDWKLFIASLTKQLRLAAHSQISRGQK